jgi:hypothetical protein
MRWLFALTLVACSSGSPETTPAVAEPVAASGASHFGAPFALASGIAAAELLADPSARVGQVVRVEGEVADVCQKAGCWMVLTDGTKNLRVIMKDHAFSVDKDAARTRAVVEGTVVEKANDPEEAKHYAEESARPEVAPEANAGERKFELVATGVEIIRG